MTNTTSTKRKQRMAREPKAEGTKLRTETAVAKVSTAPAATPRTTRKRSKADAVLSLLKREGGATLDELVEATGWLPHTTRAALTGLRKKDHVVQRTRVDGVSRYVVAKAAPQ